MFSQLLKPHLAKIYNVEIEEVRHNVQKERRIIDTLEPMMNQHRLIFDPRCIEEDFQSAKEHFSPDKAPQYMLFYQMSRISKQRGSLRHDDRLDSLAMAVKYFIDYLDVDQAYQKSREQEELLDAKLEAFKQRYYDEIPSSNDIRLWRK